MALKLLPGTQRAGVCDAVDKQCSVQMIHFMLVRSCRDTTGYKVQVVAVPIPRAQGLWRERFEPVARLCDDISFMPAPRTAEESVTLIDQALARLQEEKP